MEEIKNKKSEEQTTTIDVKPIEELTFTDNGMFQAVLHNPELCTELVERLLLH